MVVIMAHNNLSPPYRERKWNSQRRCCVPSPLRGEGADSPAGHRREEGNLVGAVDPRLGTHVVAIDGGADHFRIFESVGIALAALSKPIDQFADGGHACRRLDLLLRQAYALAHPGKIQKLH